MGDEGSIDFPAFAQTREGRFSTKKMKGTVLLIGVLVCASMTEASSVRRAKNQLKFNQHRHFKQTVDRGKISQNSNINNR